MQRLPLRPAAGEARVPERRGVSRDPAACDVEVAVLVIDVRSSMRDDPSARRECVAGCCAANYMRSTVVIRVEQRLEVRIVAIGVDPVDLLCRIFDVRSQRIEIDLATKAGEARD